MDTNVIIFMIICATVIALVAIICDYLFERKLTDISICYLSKKIVKVHRNYIVGFLGVAVIMLITARYGGSENSLFTYLSFSSTITSLVLSILAIFVTVQSSSDINKQFGTINTISTQIENSLTNLKEAESNLEKTSSDISSQMNNIVDEISKRLDVRIQKTESALSEQIKKQNFTPLDTGKYVEKKLDSNSFLKSVPYNALLGIYACIKGLETKRRFNLKLFFEGNERYQLGVIVTTTAAGYMRCSVESVDDDYIVNCTSSDMKSEEVYKIIENVSSRYGTSAEESTKTINDFFVNKTDNSET